jgi:flagellar motility protein MotE (MotC chaperone)
MADPGAENSSSYGAMERFLIWFLIPCVFTSVLLGVLFSIFDSNLKNNVLRTAHSIPVIGNLVPAPKDKADASGTGAGKSGSEASVKASNDQIAALNAKIADLEASLKKADEVNQQKDQSIKDEQTKVNDLTEQLKTKTQTDQEYQAQVQQLASVYSKMDAGKAAPIIQNLSLPEQVLVLSNMKPDAQAAILAKMDAKTAANASIAMKDAVPVKDREIAALQGRLAIESSGASTSASAAAKLTQGDVGQTFANMTPKSAADVLIQLQGTSPDRVLSILSSMDTASRAKVLSAIADANKDMAAAISSRLAASAN